MDKWIWAMYGVSVVGAVAAMQWPLVLRVFKDGPPVNFSSEYRAGVGSWTSYIAVTVLIALVVCALGFFAYAQGAIEDKLKDLGALAYFSAFTFGFSAGSAIEEPSKK